MGRARDQVQRCEADLALARREEQRATEVARNVDELLALLQKKPKLPYVEDALVNRTLGDYREKIVGAYSKLLLAERISEASSALQSGQNGTYVYVVDQDLTVKAQPVKLARSIGDETVIASGLQAGQRVVIDGQLQVIPGGKVSIKNPT